MQERKELEPLFGFFIKYPSNSDRLININRNFFTVETNLSQFAECLNVECIYPNKDDSNACLALYAMSLEDENQLDKNKKRNFIKMLKVNREQEPENDEFCFALRCKQSYKIAAMIYCRVKKDTVKIEALAVLPEYRKQGLGSLLLAMAIQHVKIAKMARNITLESLPGSIQAYIKIGFRPIDDYQLLGEEEIAFSWGKKNLEQKRKFVEQENDAIKQFIFNFNERESWDTMKKRVEDLLIRFLKPSSFRSLF